MENKKINIGMFGFGCVGQGLYDVLNHSEHFRATVGKICVKNKDKKRSIDASYFTYDKNDILNKKDYNVTVELIDDAKEAFQIVSTTLKNGGNAVSANKKMIAENFDELFRLQNENNVAFLYEGSVGGSIPIIRNLEEYYDNDLLSSISGILNGSCNYILTKMDLDNQSYASALKEAQENGFAESDPWLDVAGFDTKYKLLILTIHGFGIVLKPEQILNLGIQNVSYDDILYAREKGFRIKLIAKAEKSGDKYRVYVMPRFVPKTSDLYNTLYEFNAVEVEGAFSCHQTLVGKGAGSHPTGSAVLSDISALSYDYRYAYKKLKKVQKSGIDTSKLLDIDFDIRVYIRFQDREQLKKIEVVSIEEEFKSSKTNYIIATVKFKSLFSIYEDRENKLFICAV
jgi:homoserine dehydrogenase